MKITRATKSLLVLGIVMTALLALAGPAAALQEEPAAPAPPVEPVADVAERVIVPNPEGIVFVPQPEPVPEPAPAPKIDSAQFGVGWPAAIAVGIALLAVVAMALVWRRDQAY